MALSIRVETEGDDVVVIPESDVDMSNCGAFREKLLEAVARDHDVKVDLSAVDHMDSSGLACLVEAYRAAGKIENRLRVVNAGPAMSRILKLARIDTLLAAP